MASAHQLLLLLAVLLHVLAGSRAQVTTGENDELPRLQPNDFRDTLGLDGCAVLCLTDASGVEQCSTQSDDSWVTCSEPDGGETASAPLKTAGATIASIRGFALSGWSITLAWSAIVAVAAAVY
jgi:hypothetical protein